MNKVCELCVFSDFLTTSATDEQILYALKQHTNEIQDQVGDMTVLLSHCVKKKGALEEVHN